MGQDWNRSDRREDHDRHRRGHLLDEQSFGRDQSRGSSDRGEQGGERQHRPAGGWQDPDRGYSEEARGHHRGQDPWAGGQHRYGYGGEATSSGRQGMGGHDPYGQHGLGGQHYGEHRHPEGDYAGRRAGRSEQSGYSRGFGGEMYSGYGAQDQGWVRGDQGHGASGQPHHGQGFDPEYARWRSEQISKLDEEYRAWCQERQSKFNDEFETWRKDRTLKPSGGNAARREASISDSALEGGGSSQAGGINAHQTEDEQMKKR